MTPERRQRDKAVNWAMQFKEEAQCRLCPEGVRWPAECLDFDHLPGEVKVKDVSRFVSRGNVAGAKREAKKCVVLCASHHRLVTWGRKQKWNEGYERDSLAPPPDGRREWGLLRLPMGATGGDNSPMARRCSICSNEKKMDWVARRHLEGYTPNRMEAMSKEADIGMKRETIAKHLRVCIGTTATGEDVVRVTDEVVKANPASVVQQSQPEDVATLVQQQVVEKLKEGEARVTVQHGLQAQQLLDKRAERAKDRELAVTLARLLHSPPPPPEAITARQVDDEVIEGEAVEV